MQKLTRTTAAVLYHYPCPDGAFAALAAHLYFSAISQPVMYFPNTVYSPIKAEDLPLNEINDLYMLDFSGPAGFVQSISAHVSRVIILDHHKTALEMFGTQSSLDDNVVKVIDIERSGATIAYDYFKNTFMKLGTGRNFMTGSKIEKVNKLYKYVEDGDLWRWKLPDSKAFSSGMKDLNTEFNVKLNPTLFEELLALDYQSIISQGRVSLCNKQKLINEFLDQSYEIALGGGVFGHCLAVNADSISKLRSELGHQLAIKSCNLNLRAIGAVVYSVPEVENDHDHLLKISLRSNGVEDTTPISQNFGGGGHRNASSFMLQSSELEKWKFQGKTTK